MTTEQLFEHLEAMRRMRSFYDEQKRLYMRYGAFEHAQRMAWCSSALNLDIIGVENELLRRQKLCENIVPTASAS